MNSKGTTKDKFSVFLDKAINPAFSQAKYQKAEPYNNEEKIHSYRNINSLEKKNNKSRK